MLERATHIDAVPVEPNAPLSEYVENGGIRPKIAAALTSNILAAKELPQKFGREQMNELRATTAAHRAAIAEAFDELKKAATGTLLMPKTEPGQGTLDRYLATLDEFVTSKDAK